MKKWFKKNWKWLLFSLLMLIGLIIAILLLVEGVTHDSVLGWF